MFIIYIDWNEKLCQVCIIDKIVDPILNTFETIFTTTIYVFVFLLKQCLIQIGCNEKNCLVRFLDHISITHALTDSFSDRSSPHCLLAFFLLLLFVVERCPSFKSLFIPPHETCSFPQYLYSSASQWDSLLMISLRIYFCSSVVLNTNECSLHANSFSSVPGNSLLLDSVLSLVSCDLNYFSLFSLQPLQD
jgi:hypothetical protein